MVYGGSIPPRLLFGKQRKDRRMITRKYALLNHDDVKTAVWLAEYVCMNGNGFSPEEETSTAQLAYVVADEFACSFSVKPIESMEDYRAALDLLSRACVIRYSVRSRQGG